MVSWSAPGLTSQTRGCTFVSREVGDPSLTFVSFSQLSSEPWRLMGCPPSPSLPFPLAAQVAGGRVRVQWHISPGCAATHFCPLPSKWEDVNANSQASPQSIWPPLSLSLSHWPGGQASRAGIQVTLLGYLPSLLFVIVFGSVWFAR